MVSPCIFRHSGRYCMPDWIHFLQLSLDHVSMCSSSVLMASLKLRANFMDFIVSLIETRIIWKEEASAEELPPSDWPMRDFLEWWLMRKCSKLSPLWAAPSLGRQASLYQDMNQRINKWAAFLSRFCFNPSLSSYPSFPQGWGVS